MNRRFDHPLFRLLALLLTSIFIATPALATCGGGGGGGGGGMPSGGGAGSNAEVYHVPWKIRTPKDPPARGLILYWFPASKEELTKSSLRTSRPLSLYATQCVTMELADSRIQNADALIGNSTLPVAVLATPEGTPVTKVENKNGRLAVAEVEKVVQSEVKQRETSLDTQLKDGKAKAAAGEKEEAIKLLKTVAMQKCMFPKKAREAAKELQKLGVSEESTVAENADAPSPVFEARRSLQIQRVMERGLLAENSARYFLAEKLYTQARMMDPADPAPLRYLGELYRHHIGDWAKARTMFDEILKMNAEPLSRAVALHGLGKMTIHDGEFKKGLGLMEQAADEFPLALTYRNLAVYWHSEHDMKKGAEYTRKALESDPKDPYNIVFAAVFMAANGKKDEALKIARDNIKLLPASYNLAAIFAQNGQRDKALSLLRRHFFQYERYQADNGFHAAVVSTGLRVPLKVINRK